jgi:hypothetical protein
MPALRRGSSQTESHYRSLRQGLRFLLGFLSCALPSRDRPLLLSRGHRIPFLLSLFRSHLPFFLQLLLLLGAQGVPLRNGFLHIFPCFLLHLGFGGLCGYLPWQAESASD